MKNKLMLLESIIIKRDDRQRRELTGIEELAQSIANSGLINPPVVNENDELIAGERRVTAMRSLGWTHTVVTLFEGLTEQQQQLIELEENVKRIDLAWRDHTASIVRYHNICMEQDEDWTKQKTADSLGISVTQLSQRLDVQGALDSGDKLVVDADKYSVARNIVARKQQRKAADESAALDTLIDTVLPLGPAIPEAEAAPEDVDTLPVSSPSSGVTFINEDFHSWAATYDGPAFNFIHCDFPYGIAADKHNLGASDKFGGYEDSPEVYDQLLNTLLFDTKIADSAHLMFWLSPDTIRETETLLREAGWAVTNSPLIWHRSDNSGIMPDPRREGRRVYETCLMATRGDRFLVQPVSNLFPFPNKKTIHMSEKPREMLSHFFRMFVDETTVMLDPTMGSGNACRVTHEHGAKTVVGLEKDETFFLNACEEHDDILF